MSQDLINERGGLHSSTTRVQLKQGVAERRAPNRDLQWGPELKVSRKY